MGLQWSRDGAWKEKTGRIRTEMMRGIPRMAPVKVRRRELRYLPPVSIVVSISLIEFFLIFCELNV